MAENEPREDEQIEEVERDIEDVERDLEGDEPEYHESGDVRPDLDDQTITPPG